MTRRYARTSLPMTAAMLLGAAATLSLLSGCLIRETQVERFTLLSGGPHGTYAIEMRNVESDGETPYHQQQDFDTMIRARQSDDYLLDRMRGGIYVQARTLSVENGVLIGRERGLFLDPGSVGLLVRRNGSVRRTLSNELQVIETNGHVEQLGDTLWVEWPRGLAEMTMRANVIGFKPAASLVAKYRQWAKTK